MDLKISGWRTPEQTLAELRAMGKALGRPVRLGLQIRLVVGDYGRRRYVWWPGAHWTVSCGSLEETAWLRMYLEAAFRFASLAGPERAQKFVSRAERAVRKKMEMTPALRKRLAALRPRPAKIRNLTPRVKSL